MEGFRPAPPIPITRRYHLLSFTDFLEADGISVKRIARRIGLPHWQIGHPDDWIPLLDSMLFFREFERATGTQQLGMLISDAQNTVTTSNFSKFLDNSPTLFHALRKVCRHAQQHTSLARLWLAERNDEIALCRANFGAMSVGLRQQEQYVIGNLVGLIKYAVDPDWCPKTLWTSSPGQYTLEETKALAGSEISYEQPYTLISIPKSLVSQPPGKYFRPGRDEQLKLHQADVSLDDPTHGTLAGSLCQILVSLLKEGPVSLDVASEITRIHSRTLQRRLKKEGSSYQAVLDEARFRLALELMRLPGATVSDVSNALSYSSASNFSRSFKRFAGISPREYFSIHMQN